MLARSLFSYSPYSSFSTISRRFLLFLLIIIFGFLQHHPLERVAFCRSFSSIHAFLPRVPRERHPSVVEAIDARLPAQTRQLDVAAVAGPSLHAPALDASPVHDVADLGAQMAMAFLPAIESVFSGRAWALAERLLVPSWSASSGSAGAGSRVAVGIALQAVADAAASGAEGSFGAVALTGREAGVARGAGGRLFAVARVFLAGACSGFPAMTSGEAVGAECPLGALHLTFGPFPSGGTSTSQTSAIFSARLDSVQASASLCALGSKGPTGALLLTSDSAESVFAFSAATAPVRLVAVSRPRRAVAHRAAVFAERAGRALLLTLDSSPTDLTSSVVALAGDCITSLVSVMAMA